MKKMTLTINLKEGFNKEKVIVIVNRKEVFSDEVTTRNQIGLAKKIELHLTNPNVTLEIKIPDRQIEKIFNVDLSQGSNIGFDLFESGELLMTVSKKPFYFL